MFVMLNSGADDESSPCSGHVGAFTDLAAEGLPLDLHLSADTRFCSQSSRAGIQARRWIF